MRIVPFTDLEISEAKKLMDSWVKAKIGSNCKSYFDSENDWTGILGETAVGISYPKLIKNTQHEISSTNPPRFDFKNVKGLIIEVKTKNGTYPYRDTFQFDINLKQFNKNYADIYIGCYWQLGGNKIVIAKWVWKKDVEKLGVLTLKGSTHKQSGRVVTADKWEIDYHKMNEIKDKP